MIYQINTVQFETGTLLVIGSYEELADKVQFTATLRYTNGADQREVVYKTWSRKKLGYFDPDTMLPSSDPKIDAISEKFRGMGQERFEVRLKTLTGRI